MHSHISCCQLVALPSGLLTPHATPLFFGTSDSKEIGAHSSLINGGLDPSVGAATQSAVSESMGSLADNLTQVIESRLSNFAKRFSEENSSSVEQAVKRAQHEHYTCKRKGNQQQLDYSLQVLDKLDEASDALKQKSYKKVKVALESGTELVSKHVKAIELADKSEFGWATVNEYFSDKLASDSNNKKRIYRAERRAEKKINKEKHCVRSGNRRTGSSSAFRAASSSRSLSIDLASRSEARPACRLGPCFKVSSLLFLILLSLFLLHQLWHYTQAIIQYSP